MSAIAAAVHPPAWHGYLAWAMLALGFASALAILVDQFVLGYRQHMAVMNLVHPITALYWGPVWLWAYFTRGRRSSHRWAHRRARQIVREAGSPAEARRRGKELEEQGKSTDVSDMRPWHVGNAVSHCGAGCTLGDIAGEWLVLLLPILWFGKWSGHQLPEELLIDFLFAWTLGILFQYFTVVPMRGEGKLKGIWSAIKVDTASIVAFQAGLFGWMAIYMLVIWPDHGIKIDSPDFWFQMQIGMILGYFTAWPVNKWLVSRGIKEKMDYRRHLGMMVQEQADEAGGADEPGAREREAARGAGRRQLSERHTAHAAGVAEDERLPSQRE